MLRNPCLNTVIRTIYLAIFPKIHPHQSETSGDFCDFSAGETKNKFILKSLDLCVCLIYYKQRYSGIVQSVEQRTVNPYVTGSSPVARATVYTVLLKGGFSLDFQAFSEFDNVGCKTGYFSGITEPYNKKG